RGCEETSMRRIILTTVTVLSLSAGVAAAEQDDPVSATMDSLTRGLVQEQDVGLVFDYLREVLGAAVKGRETPTPDELRRRADEIGDEMQRRGAAAGRAVLDAIERSIREGMREPSRLPP